MPQARLALVVGATVGGATVLWAAWAYSRRCRRCRADAKILVAACDLDKTVYPPAGPDQAHQLSANVMAMAEFESLGGFVFPVTGNNIPQAQVKFTDIGGRLLRDLRSKPGIYCNGSLVMGPGGVELERHSPGQLRMAASDSDADFITALLDFWDAEAELLAGIGLLFFMPDELVALQSGAHDGLSNVHGFCKSQRVTPTVWARARLLAEKERVLQVVLLFPPLAKPGDLACYETTCRPWQRRVQEAMQAQGLMNCRVPSRPAQSDGLGDGLKLTLMKDPWPEMDICVGGVDKGSALARFLDHPLVRYHLGTDRIDPAVHVAVFGDAANDVPMFRAIGGVKPAVRVGMPHATHAELVALSTHRAEVSQMLQHFCNARRRESNSRSGVAS